MHQARACVASDARVRCFEELLASHANSFQVETRAQRAPLESGVLVSGPVASALLAAAARAASL